MRQLTCLELSSNVVSGAGEYYAPVLDGYDLVGFRSEIVDWKHTIEYDYFRDVTYVTKTPIYEFTPIYEQTQYTVTYVYA